jgi:hypothetical protein
MFTVEKFLATGEHDKMKSRLVANGNEQDPEVYPDRSSPTVTIQSILTSLVVAGSNPELKMAKVDVKGAFIQTEMEGPPVFIRLDRSLTKLVVEFLPGLKKYVEADGTLYCKLLKALYGCVQASKLWFNKLTKVLREEGYEHCPTDPCVMRKLVDGKVFLVLIYVDDLLLLADELEIKRMETIFLREFTWITLKMGNSHSYLGMQIMLEKGAVIIDMTYYVEKLLEGFDNLRIRATPGGKQTFHINEEAALLPEAERKHFHTVVARCLYLSKRARPDILTCTGFLCTRVKAATTEDKAKLEHLLGYLKATRQKKLYLKRNGPLLVEAYVDAAFALHSDSKSHTGIAVFVGGAMVFAASRKQKCMTKSPTESELVALTDNLGFVELFEEFVSFITNRDTVVPIIYQDSTSVITLVTKGGGVVRTKHLRARMHLGKEAVDEHKVNIVHVPTKQMIADGLTKPLEGRDFNIFMMAMLGIEETE